MRFDALKMLMNAMSGRELARHDRHSAGGAYWAIDGEIREVHALASHFIKMRGLAKGTAMNP